MESVFDEHEQSYILETAIESGDYLDEEKTVEGSVKDKLFLLSEEEADTYFLSEWDRKGEGTQLVNDDDNGHYHTRGMTQWWLRTTDKNGKTALIVQYWGSIEEEDVKERKGVRPAMWISLKPENES